MYKKIPLPLLLTLIRLLVAPFILPFFIILLVPYGNMYANGFVALLFVAAAMTDFFDGFFARLYSQTSQWGEILDPVADKFLMTSVWLSLLVIHKIAFVWVLILLLRELYSMSLRIVALQHAFSVKVSYLGKVKTTLQVVAATIILVNPDSHAGLGASWNILELLCLLASVGLALFSAWQYTYLVYNQVAGRVKHES